MPRHIALEWDDREVRLAVANCRGGNVRLEHTLTAALAEGENSAQAIGSALAGLLDAAGGTRGEAFVVVDRTSIELRRMKLPPAPPEELPDMARFQAVREFTNYGDDWSLDYEVLSADNDNGTWVLAAVLSPEMMKFVRKVTETAGLTLSHLLLRPFAAASLFESSSLYGESGTPLLIDTAANEADLTALADDRVVFTRTVKIGVSESDIDAFSTSLSGEVRRTMVAAQNQQAGYKVGQIVLCDDKSGGKPIADRIGEQVGIAVRVLDPLEVVDASGLSEKPVAPGRFASLFGALLEESREERHAIDFLDPKRRPPPPDKRRVQSLAVAAVALLVLTVLGGVWWRMASLDRQIAELTKSIGDNQELLKQFAEKKKELDEVNEFVDGDIIWLDELSHISAAAPPPDDAIASTFRANLLAGGDGRITLEGTMSDAMLIDDFERRMRDEAHRVAGKGGTYDAQGELPWRFTETITIDPIEARKARNKVDVPATEEDAE